MGEKIVSKAEILDALYKKASEKEKEMEKAAKGAQERANEAEGAMQSRYDTFKEEGQYLAFGLTQRRWEFTEAMVLIKKVWNNGEATKASETVSLFSVVELNYPEEDRQLKIFVFPHMGGEKVGDITVVSPHTNLFHAIKDKEEGDRFAMGARRGEILEVW